MPQRDYDAPLLRQSFAIARQAREGGDHPFGCLLADADACRSMGLDRRPALWDARRVRQGVLPLFGAAGADELGTEDDARLPPTPPVECAGAVPRRPGR